MSKNSKLPNRQVQRTCSWIFEAILLLMKEKPYSKITVSDITNKAGIARQTFYRNYKDKDEVIIQYFANIFNSELLTIENINNQKNQDTILLTFNLKYMIKHHDNIKKIISAIGSIENMFLGKFNEWQEMLIKQGKKKLNSKMQLVYRYKIYYQIGGILRIIMDWFMNNMPIPVCDLVDLINYFTVDTKNHYENVPNIKIEIIEH